MWEIAYQVREPARKGAEVFKQGTATDMSLPGALTLVNLRLFGLDVEIELDEAQPRERVFVVDMHVRFVPP